MALPGNRSLLLRLQHDLSELISNPYPGVRVFIDDSNIRKFCLVLTPPSGPWKDLSLHFDVELPYGWPASPPMIFSSVEGISHPNIRANYICCDLLKEQDELEKGYSGGYTPALTLRGLFLQFLTFFSSTKVEQTSGGVIDIGDYKIIKYVLLDSVDHSSLWDDSPHAEDDSHYNEEERTTTKTKHVCIPMKRIESINPRWHTAYNLVKRFKCKSCPYNTPKFPIHAVVPPPLFSSSPQVLTGYLTPSSLPSPTTSATPTPTSSRPSLPIRLPSNPRRRKTGCTLDILPSDLLLYLATFLPTSSDLLSLSTAYPRFHALTLGHSQLKHKMLFADELRCFFLRTPLNEGLSDLAGVHRSLIKSGASASPLASPLSPSSLPPMDAPTPASALRSLSTHKPHPPILGIGISYAPSTRTLHSDFDFLSYEAYSDHGVRTSVISKRKFEYFLPLAFGRDHFERAEVRIWECLGVLDGVVAEREPGNVSARDRARHALVAQASQTSSPRTGSGNGSKKLSIKSQREGRKPQRTPLYLHPPIHHWQTVRVIYRMMNNIVVSLMKTCDGVMEWERERERREKERRDKRVERRAERRRIDEELRAQSGVGRRMSTLDVGGGGLGLGLFDGGGAQPAGGLLFEEPESGDDLGLGLGLSVPSAGAAGAAGGLGLLMFDEPTPLPEPHPPLPTPLSGFGDVSHHHATTGNTSSTSSSTSTSTTNSTTPAYTNANDTPNPTLETLLAPSSNKQPQPTLLHASERSIISYLHLFHLLLCLGRSHPEIVDEAREGVEEFVRGGKIRAYQESHNGGGWIDARGKERVGNLGEFIVRVLVVLAWRDEDVDGMSSATSSRPGSAASSFTSASGADDGYDVEAPLLSRSTSSMSSSSTGTDTSTSTTGRREKRAEGGKPLSWSQINGPFLEEAITRNVFWCLKSSAVLECLEAPTPTSSSTPAPTSSSGPKAAAGPAPASSKTPSYSSAAATVPSKEMTNGTAGGGPGPADMAITWSERYRLEKTFETSLTSLRLIMFQVAFLEGVVGGLDGIGHGAEGSSSVTSPTSEENDTEKADKKRLPKRQPSLPLYDPHHDPRSLLTRLDASYGYPPDPSIPEKMVKSIKAIYGVRTWPAFFERVRWRRGRGLFESVIHTPGGEAKAIQRVVVSNTSPKFVAMLRSAVAKSAERGYHNPKRPREMHLLWREREKVESGWKGEVKERERVERVERERELREMREREVRERRERERVKRKESAGGALGLGLGLSIPSGMSGGPVSGGSGKGKEVRWV